MVTEDEIRQLGTGRWTVPLLALLLEHNGARFATLVSDLGIARDSLARTLAHVAGCGWVVRNPGYGHPLRPEYVLTASGGEVATACVRLMQARQRLGLGRDSLSRWSMPILGRLRCGWARFSDLRADLAPITSRALSLSLKQMIDGRLVIRRLDDFFPPGSLYGLAPPGRELVRAVQND